MIWSDLDKRGEGFSGNEEGREFLVKRMKRRNNAAAEPGDVLNFCGRRDREGFRLGSDGRG